MQDCQEPPSDTMHAVMAYFAWEPAWLHPVMPLSDASRELPAESVVEAVNVRAQDRHEIQ